MSETDEIVRSLANSQRQAQSVATGWLGADPEKAARAMQLEDATGVPAQAISEDLEGFELDHKTALTAEMLRSNQHLSDYVTNNPMAAQVSNDDYGNLDGFSQAMGKLGKASAGTPMSMLSLYSNPSILGHAAEAFKEGFGSDPLVDYGSKSKDPTYTILGQILKYSPIAAPVAGAVAAVNLSMRTLGGLTHGVLGGAMEAMRQSGMDETQSRRLGRDLLIGTQVAMSGQAGFHMPPEFNAIAKATKAAEPWLKAGIEPPMGIDPWIDSQKHDQARADAKALKEALKAAEQSATRERSPELFAKYARQHIGESTIEVSGEALAKLYGDKLPSIEDGLFGWVPDLQKKIELAVAHGGGVDIPLADWLARVDPQVANDLNDFIRVRRGGVTLEEMKEKPKEAEKPEVVGEEMAQVESKQPEIDAVRKQAGLKPLVEAPLTETGLKPPPGTEPIELTERTTAHVKKEYTPFVQKVIDRIKKDIARIAPQTGEVLPAVSIEISGRSITGVMVQYADRLPTIAYSLLSDDPIGTARHEAIHVLRQGGFITAAEWNVLKKAVDDYKLIDKHDIKTRYKGSGLGLMYEEAIAEEFKLWAKFKDEAQAAKHPLAKVFEKIKQFVERIKETFLDTAKEEGLTGDFYDIWERIYSGEVGKREAEPLHPEAFRKAKFEPMAQEEIISPIDPRRWMTKDQHNRYMKKIAERDAEDQARQLAKAEKDIRKRQTEEWKNNERQVKSEVIDEITNRPDIAADALLRSSKIKLDIDKIKPELRASLPKDVVGKGGIAPDDLAGHFGYQSGEALVNRIAILEGARKAQNLQPKQYVNELVKAESERRMQEKFGDLDENILKEAQEHVVSTTQMDLLHEETVALGMKAGSEVPFGRADFEAWVKDRFAETKVSGISVDKFLDAAGRAGKKVESALLHDDFTDAFQQKQAQYISMLLAKEAKRFEKTQEQFEKTAKRQSERVLPRQDSEYTNWIHDILMRTDAVLVKRTVQDLQEQISKAKSGLTTLEDFVVSKEADLREVPVADFLLDPNFRKSVKDMTVAEFQAVADSVKALVKNGNDELKLIREGDEADLRIKKTELIGQLLQFKEKYYDADGKRWLLGVIPPGPAKFIRTVLASHLQLEALFNRWDKGDTRGVWTQWVMRELSTAATHEARMERDFSRKLKELKDEGSLKESVQNDLFIDPYSTRFGGDPRFINLTRKNLRAILLNAGNESNMKKLADGYGIKPEQIMQWLHRNATKEDWTWAQGVGDIFAELKGMSDTMYRSMTGGVAAENIPIKPIDTPHGQFAGWYYPLIKHPIWEGQGKASTKGLEQDNYVRATTPAGYTKKRTGAIYPLDLDLDRMPNEMKSQIHDITFRPAVINASKIFLDKDVQAAITKHYGIEYTKLLEPYLKDVANAANFTSDASSVMTQWMEYARQNMISVLIGFNPGTVMKHTPTAAINSVTEVGLKNLSREFSSLYSINDATGETNWNFAMKASEELSRRMRHYVETLRGSKEDVLRERTARESFIAAGAWTVAKFDLLSAVPTWLARYKEVMKETGDHGEAVYHADKAVRQAHGSSAITNRPAAMRGGAMAQWLTSLYGFFSHMFNKQYEIAWRSADAIGMAKEGEYKEAAKQLPRISGMLFSYVIIPAIIEELVTPLFNDKKESWGFKAAKILGLGATSSWIGIRDLAHAMALGHDPSAGLLSSYGKTYTDLVRDFGKGTAFTKQKAGNTVKHAISMIGATTGFGTGQLGRWTKFSYDYMTGQQRPRTIGDWYRVFRYGEAKERKH